MYFLQVVHMFNQCFFKRLMRPPIIINVCLLELKRIGYKTSLLGVEKIPEKLWKKGKGNRLPNESMTWATQRVVCIAVV